MFLLSDEVDIVYKIKVYCKIIVVVLREDIYYDLNYWMFYMLSVI